VTAADLIADYARAGIQLTATGDRLHVAADRPVTAGERANLVKHKAELLMALSGTRGHLLALALSAGIPAAIVHVLPDDDLDAVPDDYSDAQLIGWLHLRL
jgi:hypothetical protein